jgi:hypothetical protein
MRETKEQFSKDMNETYDMLEAEIIKAILPKGKQKFIIELAQKLRWNAFRAGQKTARPINEGNRVRFIEDGNIGTVGKTSINVTFDDGRKALFNLDGGSLELVEE